MAGAYEGVSMPTETVFIGVALVGLLLLVFFLVLREVVCWYWKINRMVQLLESIAGSVARSQKIEPLGASSQKIEPLVFPSLCGFCGEKPAVGLFRDVPVCSNCSGKI